MQTNDLISREAAIKMIRENGLRGEGYSREEREDNLVDMLECLPDVDAAPVVHGRWIQNKTVPSYHFCSNCKRAHNMPKSCNVYVLPFYCPDCGAKMDKEVNEE